MPIGLILGVFTGSLLYHVCIHNDWKSGIIVGIISAIIAGVLGTIFHIN